MSSPTKTGKRGPYSIIGIKVGLSCPACGSGEVHLDFARLHKPTGTVSDGQPYRLAYLTCRECHQESARVDQSDVFVLIGWDVWWKMIWTKDRRGACDSPELKDTVLEKLGKMFGWKVAVTP